MEAYLKAAGMFRDYSLSSQDPIFSESVELDLSTVVPSLSGPKRPHDRVAVSDMKADFQMCLDNKVWYHVPYNCILCKQVHTVVSWTLLLLCTYNYVCTCILVVKCELIRQ